MRHGWMAALGMSALVMAGPARGQPAPGPSQAALDRTVQLGTIAALAHLCGLRAEAWSFDLRRAAILDASGATQPDDLSLEGAPGSSLVVGALSYAEAEALEDFAKAAPARTCEPLKRNPDLARADAIVETFRKFKAKVKTGS